MSTHTLTVPYADTRADQLTLTIGQPPLPALAERDWHLGAITVSLRLLGASHQVFVRGDVDFAETLACLPGRSGALPTTFHDVGYRFDAVVTTEPETSLRNVVHDLTARAAAADDAGAPALLGRFPRHPLAVTALFAQLSQTHVRWQTWHVYPQSGEIVATRSELDVARRGAA